MVVSYCYTYASPVAELPVAVGGAAPFRTHWSASLAVEAAPVAELRVVVGEGAPFRTRWSASLAVEASVLDVPRAMEAPPLGWSAVEVSPATICAERHSTTFSNLSALAFCFSSLAQIAELSISFLLIFIVRAPVAPTKAPRKMITKLWKYLFIKTVPFNGFRQLLD